VSVNGAEEDGVDNRVEAPSWVPDGGSDSVVPGEESERATVPAPESQADSGEDKLTAAQDTSAGTRPKISRGSTAEDEPSDASARSGSGSSSGFEPQSGNGATPPGPVMAPPAPPLPAAAAVAAQGMTRPPSSAVSGAAGAASAARGLAARVSANISGLTKPKPKPKPKPKAKPRVTGGPYGQGLPPARPQVPAGQRPPGLNYGPVSSPQSRRAQLRLDRIEPWSVMKFSFLISIVGWVILLVAVSVLYFVLSKLGVFTSIEHTVGLVTTSKSKPGSNAASWFKASRILGYTMLVGAINVVLMTALATIGAVLYNLVTLLAGGIEVTLKESD
jgi:Transmembrane domain of unknown function (DUF3566)